MPIRSDIPATQADSPVIIPGEDLFQPLPVPYSERFERLVEFCETHNSEVLASLPHVAAELADGVGYEALFRFLRLYNGNSIAFAPNHQAFAARYGLALDAARYERLRHLCNGNPAVDIPSGCGMFNALRRVAVQRFLSCTGDPREAARRFGVTRRYLRKLTAQ
jgi:hypothetical protein